MGPGTHNGRSAALNATTSVIGIGFILCPSATRTCSATRTGPRPKPDRNLLPIGSAAPLRWRSRFPLPPASRRRIRRPLPSTPTLWRAQPAARVGRNIIAAGMWICCENMIGKLAPNPRRARTRACKWPKPTRNENSWKRGKGGWQRSSLLSSSHRSTGRIRQRLRRSRWQACSSTPARTWRR